jgi:large subunit ribosomal protein L22
MAEKKEPKKPEAQKAGTPKSDAKPAVPRKVRTAPPLARSRKNRPAPPVAGPHASLSFLRIAPRKVRLVADQVRGMRVGDALAVLKFRPHSAAKPLAKLLRSAVANAENKGGRVDVDALTVKTLTVDQGPKMRRFMPRAQGRAYRVEKKTSHVYVELGT